MNFLKYFTLLSFAIVLVSCEKDDDNNDDGGGTSGLQVPATYAFVDSDGNSTVSYSGQAERLDMLAEITTYMKSANTSGVTVDAQTLKDMYANVGYTWTDANELGMTGSSKQLKNKTAAGASGNPDPAVQNYFEGLMTALAGVSNSPVAGGPGVAGVVVSTSNPSKQYLCDANGAEYTQYIEKGLMGAVFYNQIAMNYLGDDRMNADNTTAVDPDNGKYYTLMEHYWDEAYGYFTTATDYTVDGDGASDRFWGKYAGGSREELLQTGTKIYDAFRRGRAAISANDLEERDVQRAIIREEMAKVVAGTAIHYLNDAVADFGDDALRNHVLSEAVAFISDIPYGYEPIANQQQTTAWLVALGSDFYNITTADILNVRDQIAEAAGLNDFREDL